MKEKTFGVGLVFVVFLGVCDSVFVWNYCLYWSLRFLAFRVFFVFFVFAILYFVLEYSFFCDFWDFVFFIIVFF